MSRRFLFTSESVGEGHPDKVADQIADGVLDALITDDPDSRVACEVMVTTGLALISGEITSRAYVDLQKVVRETIRGIGYVDPRHGFDADSCAVLAAIDEQSPDIAQGVIRPDPEMQGAGDQGMMFGYACDETDVLMPLPSVLAHGLVKRLSQARRSGALPFLRPDGKAQVTVGYEDGRPRNITAVVVSAQHNEDVALEALRGAIREEVIDPVLPKDLVTPGLAVHINPTGRFVRGGPQADTGLTGRKIIVDTYGGMGRHGGGAFSGKDPSKVDRSASYAARWVAKNIVAAGLARRCEVQIAYAIGVAEPVSVMVETFGTETIPVTEIEARVRRTWDLRPFAIIRDLKLRRPIYSKTAVYGHFGRNEPEFTWEATDKVATLKG